MSEPFSIESLKPSDVPEYMVPAWISFVLWSIGNKEIVKQFRSETGNQWRPGRTAIEQMIDSAAGIDRQFMVAFVEWVNVNLWGPVDASEGTD